MGRASRHAVGRCHGKQVGSGQEVASRSVACHSTAQPVRGSPPMQMNSARAATARAVRPLDRHTCDRTPSSSTAFTLVRSRTSIARSAADPLYQVADIVLPSASPRTSIRTRAPAPAMFIAACPAELPAPTTTTSSPPHWAASLRPAP